MTRFNIGDEVLYNGTYKCIAAGLNKNGLEFAELLVEGGLSREDLNIPSYYISIGIDPYKKEGGAPGSGKYWVPSYDSDAYDLFGNRKESLIDKMIPYQTMYNVCMNKIKEMMGEGGLVEKMPEAMLITRTKRKRRRLL